MAVQITEGLKKKTLSRKHELYVSVSEFLVYPRHVFACVCVREREGGGVSDGKVWWPLFEAS